MIEVYIDGASAGNPGPSGIGIFIKNNGQVESHSIPLGQLTNHEAEFMALIRALEICRDRSCSIISVRSDSALVVDAVENTFVRNKKYAPLLDTALQLARSFELFFIKWIPSKENKKADELARKAIRMNR
ncbi:reverse transcriptase-like protein [Siminovitchia fortis]|uniref:Reverse transcriptase-like protein n=1 Tax=Siminovitchia fortis TaxID=254758 RepID=A0A443IS58_9BACI|nr:reverse transcriptase-like protein [Siminovitchia fortis]RWR10392.1 reverse transcriptase-like protein [Siminovitchia fortis]WHY82933.1 reverse transcriptase-like protein [Siminovitchia fortis]